MKTKMEQVCRGRINNNPDLTNFQKKVLNVVLMIPRGSVRSYAWVAERSGSTGACRVVGQIMAMNPYAPDVPCHRVIASDGSIGGYSRGIGAKRKLLEEEGVIAQKKKA
ncbi:MAG: MGMT family protein [Candidatus Omnitrophota bacterium]